MLIDIWAARAQAVGKGSRPLRVREREKRGGVRRGDVWYGRQR